MIDLIFVDSSINKPRGREFVNKLVDKSGLNPLWVSFNTFEKCRADYTAKLIVLFGGPARSFIHKSLPPTGEGHVIGDTTYIPWHDTYYLFMANRKYEVKTLELFSRIKEKLDAELVKA